MSQRRPGPRFGRSRLAGSDAATGEAQDVARLFELLRCSSLVDLLSERVGAGRSIFGQLL